MFFACYMLDFIRDVLLLGVVWLLMSYKIQSCFS
jgi:hypothetical protein